MTTDKLIDSLDRSGLISADLVANLRQRMLESWQGFEAADVVRWLVVEGHITAAQGDRLLRDAGPPPAGAVAATRKAIPNPYEDLEVLPDDEEDDVLPPLPEESMPGVNVGDSLDLLPLDDPRPPKPPRKAPAAQPKAGGSTAPKATGAAASDASRASRSWRSEVQPTSNKGPAAPQPRATAPARAAAPKALDDLLGDSLLSDSLGDESGAVGAGRLSREASRRGPLDGRPRRGTWDSPLMLIGGGVLVLLLIGGGALYWSLNRQTAAKALEQAETDYRAGSFAQAIHKFDYYLENYPKDGNVGMARVHRGLARLRQAKESAGGNWPPALETANQVLAEISTETEFADAHGELAALLPDIAEGLAKQADADPSQALVDQSHEALALVEKYVPAQQRQDKATMLTDIEASLAATKRRLNRDKALADALVQIRQALAQGAVAQTYATRKQLLKAYPDLAASDALKAVVVEMAKAEQASVKFVADARAAEKTDVASPIKASLALAVRSGSAAPDVQGETVLALAEGAVYGLDATSGQPLWRRFVGFDADFAARQIPGRAGGDGVLVDTVRSEVLRVDARTGDVRWRQTLADAFDARPVLLRDRVLVSTRSGRLVSIDVETGAVKGYVQLPQRLVVGPAVDSRGQHYYQLAEHSNLYVLSAADGRCMEVDYLGHEPGTIDTPPLMVGRYLFVAENNGAEDSVLRVLLTNEEGVAVSQAEQVPLRGHVRSAPQATGRTLVVATDRGALYSFEVAAAGQSPVLTKAADKPADEQPPLVRFPILQSGELWVAGIGLTKFDIQAARGRLAPKWIDDDGDVLLRSPEVIGRTIVFARKRRGLPGVVVAAVSGDDGNRYWETQLASPPAGAPMASSTGDKMLALSTLGTLFEIPADGLAKSAILNQAAAKVAVAKPLSADARVIRLSADRTIMAAIGTPADGKQAKLLVVDAAPAARLRWLPLSDEPATPPLGFRGGLLVPGKLGQIMVVDAETGRNLVEPFQPRLEAARRVEWTEPALVAETGALVSDRTRLFRLAVADQPVPHLAAAAEAGAAAPLASPLAILDRTAYAVDDRKQLVSFDLAQLAPGKSWPLGGNAVWGPRRIGDVVLLATHDQICCLDGAQNLRWQVALEHGPLAGEPLRAGNAIVLAAAGGTVFRLAADTGKELGKQELEQPIAAGPIAWREGLLVVGPDGTLHVISNP
jgi:outer membrane protein assembly factor BamB